MIFRAIVLTADTFVFANAQFYLPLPLVHTIGCTGTLYVFILDYYINSVKISKKQLSGIVIGFVGVILTINGEWMMDILDPEYNPTSEFQNYKSDSFLSMFLASLSLVLILIVWSYGCILVKMITNQNTYQWIFHTGTAHLLLSAFF